MVQQIQWLHYQEGSDTVLCFYCMVAEMRNLPVSRNKDDVFCKSGFTNWKKALEKFDEHQKTLSHHEAVDVIQMIPNTSQKLMLERCLVLPLLIKKLKIETVYGLF